MKARKEHGSFCMRVLLKTQVHVNKSLKILESSNSTVGEKKGTLKRGSFRRHGVYSMGHCLQTGWIQPTSTSTPPLSQNYPCTCPLALYPSLSFPPPNPSCLGQTVLYSVDSGNTQSEVERYGKPQLEGELIHCVLGIDDF